MSKVEETVSTEPAKPAIGADAFAAARASIAAQSQDHGTTEDEPQPETTPSTETPAQEPEKVADEPQEPTEPEDTILSADELAALPAKERAKAEKWVAKLTRKSQELSAQAKQYDEWKSVIDGLTADPDGMLEELARTRGLTVTKPQSQDTTVKADIQGKFTKALAALPEDIRPMFQPALEALGQEVLSSVEGRLKPITETHTQILSQAAADQTEATEKAFEAKYPDYRKVESQMLELGKKFMPIAGTMTTFEYLEHLYSLVKSRQTKAEQVKETVKQINRSAASVEPHAPGVPEARVQQTMPANWSTMTDRERMRAAYDAASKGIVWNK